MCYRTEASETVHCVCNAGMSRLPEISCRCSFRRITFCNQPAPFLSSLATQHYVDSKF